MRSILSFLLVLEHDSFSSLWFQKRWPILGKYLDFHEELMRSCMEVLYSYFILPCYSFERQNECEKKWQK